MPNSADAGSFSAQSKAEVGGETKLLLLWEPLVIVVPRSGRNPIYRCVRRMERFFDRANFIGPVVDCIEAKFCKQICV